MDEQTLDRLTGGAHFMNAPDPRPPPQDDGLAPLRIPPHSTEAEQSLLGGLLVDSTAFGKISDQVSSPDFYAKAHQQIFVAITSLIGDSKPVDVVTVFERLGDQVETIGGLSYITALANSVPSASSIVRYAEIVVERATLRAAITELELATSRAFKQDSAASILDDAKVALGKLSELRSLGSKRMPLLSLDQLREHSHSVTWLVKRVIPADSIGMIFGGSGTFKSFIALDFALHVAHGLTWMGRRTTQGPVIYIAAEGGAGLWGRIVAWHRARGLPWDKIKDTFKVIPRAVDLTADSWRVAEAAQSQGITPVLVIIDTLSQTYSGEENSANEMAAYFREIGERLRALWRCAVAIIHHTGHGSTERPRGSSAIRANLDWMLGVFRDEKEMLATLTCSKQKDGEAFEDATFAMSVRDLGTDEDGDRITSLVAHHLSSAEELQEAMGRESNAGRGGNNQLLLSLLQNGSKESDLRKAFYDQVQAETPEARRQAYHRAKSWATKKGFFEVAEGYILTLKPGA